MRPPVRRLTFALAAGLTLLGLQAQTAPATPVLKLEDFVVTPSRFSVARESDGSRATLLRADLEALPQVGEDLFRAIARLPGVAADDFTAKFWVRGAPQRQVLVRLDGAELLEPFHLKDVDGALSIVDLRVVDRLDLLTGGFTAEFGDRSAAVLTIDTLRPTRRQPGFSAGLSLTSMRLGAEGTLAEGRGRWLASARRGYPDLALKFEDRAEDIIPRYWDAYAKAEFELTPQHTLSWHVLHAADSMRIEDPDGPDLRSSYESDTLWLRWLGSWSDQLSSETVISQAWLTWRRHGDGLYQPRYRLELRDRRSLSTTAARQDWTAQLSEKLFLRTGWQAEDSAARYSYSLYREDPTIVNGALVGVPRSFSRTLRPRGERIGAFVATRHAITPRLAVEPGLRFDRATASGDRDWSPRLNAAWEIRRGTTLRAAWGRYTQAQGVHELAVAFDDPDFHPSEKAEHRVIALEQTLPLATTLRVEAYQRITRDPRPQWFNRYDVYSIFPEAQSDRIRLAPTQLEAQGLEIIARRRAAGRFDWSASYALSKSTQELPTGAIPTARDQRHAFSTDLTYRLGDHWRLSAAWYYHTGWPITGVSYAQVPLNNGRRALVRSFGPTLGERLPSYHRLDLRVSRHIPLQRGELVLFFDVFNAYDRANPLAYDYEPAVIDGVLRDGRKPRNLLPIVPSLGLSWSI